MIIKGERVASSRAIAPLIKHLLHGDENDEIFLLQGTADDIRSAFTDARNLDRKYSLRHFIIAPAVETSDDDARMVLKLLAREYAFDSAESIFLKHLKPRAGEAFGGHWHALIREQDPATGRTLSSRFNYLRNLKVSCIAAHRLGHPMIALPHEAAVLNALESDGHIEVMSAVRAASDAGMHIRPREGFSTDVHQMGKRRGADIPAARAAVRAAWETTFDRETFEVVLTKDQLRIRAGDKPDTFIVETLTGVFVGAAHRLARVRRVDFLVRMKEDQNARDNQSADECKTVPRIASLGNPEHQNAPEPTGPAGARERAGSGSGSGIAKVDINGNSRSADQQRGPPPTHGRHRSLRAGSSARRFRQALNRNPARAHQILSGAKLLARPPIERVALQLYNHEDHLQARLRALLSRPPPGAALAAAQHEKANLVVRIDKYEKAIAVAKAHVRTVAASERRGLKSRVDGTRHRWEQRRSAAETRCTALVEKHSSLCDRLLRVSSSIADLDRSEAQQHSRALRSEESAARLARFRDQIDHIHQSRARLGIFPAIAWGGVAMALAVVAAIATTDEAIESESGPLIHPLATDLWGVGLRWPPR